jgi:hypothetical protein
MLSAATGIARVLSPSGLHYLMATAVFSLVFPSARLQKRSASLEVPEENAKSRNTSNRRSALPMSIQFDDWLMES